MKESETGTYRSVPVSDLALLCLDPCATPVIPSAARNLDVDNLTNFQAFSTPRSFAALRMTAFVTGLRQSNLAPVSDLI
jgi:hypothetical protein